MSGELGSGPCRGFVAEATARAPSAPLGVEGSDRFRRPHGPRHTGCGAPVSMRYQMPLTHAGGMTAAAVASRTVGVFVDPAVASHFRPKVRRKAVCVSCVRHKVRCVSHTP